MSDDPNRPDADHELDVDISAFLPEGSRFATDDDELDEAVEADGPGGDSDPANEADGGPGDGGAFGAAAVSSEAPAGGANANDGAHLGVDGASEVDDGPHLDVEGASEVDDGWDTGAPAPEIPAWAIDDLPPPPVVDGPDQPVDDDASEPAPVADTGPAVPAAPDVDTTVLTRIEGELADVDAAIAAIDSGDLARSPLLTELLAADATPAGAAPADAASLDAASLDTHASNGHLN